MTTADLSKTLANQSPRESDMTTVARPAATPTPMPPANDRQSV